MDLNKLKEPFPAEDIEWRLQQADKGKNGIWAKCLAYVTNRAIMNRLDEVCGPENWKNEFDKAPNGGVLCGISIKVGDTWITKYDGSDNTQIEATKGGLSGSMKRAAVQWGIGRYLYYLDEGWATVVDNGTQSGKTKDGTCFKWNPPILPQWALPGGSGKPPAKQQNKTSASQKMSQTSNAQKTPKFPGTDEAKQLKNSILDWINNGTISDKQSLAYAEDYMFNNDVAGMKQLAAWCQSQQKPA